MKKLFLLVALIAGLSSTSQDLTLKGRIFNGIEKTTTITIIDDVEGDTSTWEVKKTFGIKNLDASRNYTVIFTNDSLSKTLFINQFDDIELVKEQVFIMDIDWEYNIKNGSTLGALDYNTQTDRFRINTAYSLKKEE